MLQQIQESLSETACTGKGKKGPKGCYCSHCCPVAPSGLLHVTKYPSAMEDLIRMLLGMLPLQKSQTREDMAPIINDMHGLGAPASMDGSNASISDEQVRYAHKKYTVILSNAK